MSEVGCRKPTVAQSLIYWCFALLDSFSGLRLGIVDLDLQHWVPCQQFRRNLLGSTLFRKVSLKVSIDNHIRLRARYQPAEYFWAAAVRCGELICSCQVVLAAALRGQVSASSAEH